MWILHAFGSAFFAGMAVILAKCGTKEPFMIIGAFPSFFDHRKNGNGFKDRLEVNFRCLS